MVSIVIDVTVDLPRRIVRKHDIRVVPLYIIRDKERIPVDYEFKYVFYKKFRDEWLSGKLKTSQPSIGDFLEIFKECEDDILVFTISSELSGTYNVAINASRLINKNVNVIDTRNASVGSGLLVLLTIKLLERYKLDRVIKIVDRIKKEIKTFAFIEDIRYLLNSGRIDIIRYSFLRLINKRPVITVSDGKLELFKLSSDLLKDFYELERQYKIKLYGSNTKKVMGKEILVNPIVSIHLGPAFGFAALK